MFNPKFNMEAEKEELRRRLPPIVKSDHSFLAVMLFIAIVVVALALLFLPSPI